MADFTQTERDALRVYMGYSRIWTNANSMFEGVLDAINGLANNPPPQGDGGATQAAVRVVLGNLQNLDTMIANNMNLMLGTQVNDSIKVDAIRQDYYWRSVNGPALIRQLANRMSINPASDYYSQAEVDPSGDIYMHNLRRM